MYKIRKIIGIISFMLLFLISTSFTLHAAKISRIKESGMARDYSFNMFSGGKPVDQKSLFDPSESIYWFCSIKNGSTWGQPKMRAKWFSPDGSLFKEEPFSSPKTHCLYAKAQFPIEGGVPSELCGDWRVLVYWDEEKVDEQVFSVMEPGSSLNHIQSENEIREQGQQVKRFHVDDILSIYDPESISKSRSDRLTAVGLSVDYDGALNGGRPIDQRILFSEEDEKVTWWCKLKTFSSFGKPELKIYWVDPQGYVYKERKFSTPWGNVSYARTEFELKDVHARELYGKWRTIVFWNDEIVDSQEFEIQKNEGMFSEEMREAQDSLFEALEEAAGLPEYLEENTDMPKIIQLSHEYPFAHLDVDFDFVKVSLLTMNPIFDRRSMSEKKQIKIISKFKEEFHSLGFSFDSQQQPDIKIKIKLKKVKFDTFSWFATGIECSFIDAKDSAIISSYKTSKRDTLNRLIKDISHKIVVANASLKLNDGESLKEKITQVKQTYKLTPKYSFTNIYKERPAVHFIQNPSYKNVGLLFLPATDIMNEHFYYYYNEQPYVKYAFDDDPHVEHSYQNIAKDLEDSKGKIKIITNISEERQEERKVACLFRDDFRDLMFLGFRSLFEKYEANVYEIRFEDFKERLFQKTLGELLEEVRSANPTLNDIYVVYYRPYSHWCSEDSYRRYFKSGVWLFNKISFFQYDKSNGVFKRKSKDTMSALDDIGYSDLISYHDLYSQYTNELDKEIDKKINKYFTKKTDQEKNTIYLVRKNIPVIDSLGNHVGEFFPKIKGVFVQKNDLVTQVVFQGYVNKNSVEEMEEGKKLKICKDTMLLNTLFLKNKFGESFAVLRKEFLAKIEQDALIDLEKPVEWNTLDPDLCKITFNVAIPNENLSTSYDAFRERGKVTGRIVDFSGKTSGLEIALYDGEFLSITKLKKDGSFCFKNVLPGKIFQLCYKVSGVVDKKKIEAWNLIATPSKQILLNPGETVDLGYVEASNKNITDYYELKKKSELIFKELGEYKGYTKQQVIYTLGKPLQLISNDIFKYKYKGIFVYIYFNKEMLSGLKCTIDTNSIGE